MSLAELLSTPVTIISRSDTGQTDELGNEIPTETSVETVGDLQQRQRAEPGDQGEFSVSEWVLFLPSGTAIDTGDAVVIDGRIYELVGDPWDAQQGHASVHHVEATVKRAAGEETGS